MLRTPGMKVIIGYKLVKAPLMLVLAIWLTFRGPSALRVADAIARELADAGARWERLAQWISVHVTARAVAVAAVVAWLDAVVTALEGALLLTGRTWGEWIVLFGIAALLPLEIEALVRHPGPFKALGLVANAVIVAYLAWRRTSQARNGR
jgi:uncharacterized membrane protein (DUF2068 family)